MRSPRSRRAVRITVGTAVAFAGLYALSWGANLPADPSFEPEAIVADATIVSGLPTATTLEPVMAEPSFAEPSFAEPSMGEPLPAASNAVVTTAPSDTTAVTSSDPLRLLPVAATSRPWAPTAKPKRVTVKPFTSVAFTITRPVTCRASAECSRPARATASVTRKAVQAVQVVLQWCAMLADAESERQQGLMDRKDLADHDGMIFEFSEDSTAAFYMYRTVMPLSIVWFDAAGAFVSATDMEPCTDPNPGNCPVYPAQRPYRYALEVPKGGLAAIGAGPGSVLRVGGTCRS